MRHRLRLTIGALALLAALHMAAAAVAAPPRSLSHLTTISQSPAPAQKQEIEAYVRGWFEALEQGDAVRANAARDKLMEPPGAPGVTVVFRDAYSDAVVPQAQAVLKKDGAHLSAAVAMQVLGEVATDEALRVINEHLAQRDEPRVGVRLSAAKAFNRAMERGLPSGAIPSGRVAGAVRGLGQAARSETDPRPLRWQLESLASLDRSDAREELFDALDAAVRRAREGQAAGGIVDAVRPSIITLRKYYLDPGLPLATQRSLGRAMAPMLANLLEVPLAHWDATRSDAELRAVAESAIRIAEQLLQFVDSNVQGSIGRTTLDAAFTGGDRASYESQMQGIRSALEQPPFR